MSTLINTSQEIDARELEHAVEEALYALKLADDFEQEDKNEKTGWRSDELCEAYQTLHSIRRAFT